jgi:hypothetical protein
MKNETCGIYLITEKASRRDVYVGQSIGIEGRWVKHKGKYPADRFDYRILLECPRCDLDFWEQHYIRVLKTHWTEGGENQNWGGQFWPRPEEPISPATRAKLSASHKGQVPHNKGKPRSSATRAKISAANKGQVPPNKGKPMSEEQKAKLRNRVVSEETRAKQSASKKGAPIGPMSEEHRSKISAAKKGVPVSEETRAKQSVAQKGKVQSEETKAKRSATLTGRVMSEEQKMKLSESAKARAALKRAAKAAADAALESLISLESNTENIPSQDEEEHQAVAPVWPSETLAVA